MEMRLWRLEKMKNPAKMWSEIYGLSFKTLHSRVFLLKWPVEKALTQKVKNANVLQQV